MANPGLNMAVTTDGETYNKLQRPADYLLPSISQPPSLATAIRPITRPSKRKLAQDVGPRGKRARVESTSARLTESKDQLRVSGLLRDCGMRTMLPGLDEEEQLSDDSIGEAIAYLRSVRTEASLIPPLLVASTSGKSNGSDDNKHPPCAQTAGSQRVVYKEGILIAVDEGHRAVYDEDDWNDSPHDLDPQGSCYKLLLKRFQSLRNKLMETRLKDPDQDVTVTTMDPDNAEQPRSKYAWFKVIDREYPTLAQVLQMDERSVYLALQVCATSLDYSTTVSHEKSCWIWTLLALTGDIGTLDHERIGRIRDLGLKAGWLGARLRQDTVRNEQGGGANAGTANMEVQVQEIGGEDEQERSGENAGDDIGDKNVVEAAGVVLEKASRKVDRLLLNSGEDSQHGVSLKGDESGFGADMSMSDNEAEVCYRAETKDLEQARARLLAQLGDRLVQPGIPSSATPSFSRRAQRFCPPSRADAERLRQQTRGQASRNETLQHTSSVCTGNITHHIGANGSALSGIDWNTRAAIDMILTIVAECYGQRDLVRFREAW